QRLTLAEELQSLPEELKSFQSYAQLYQQQGNYLTARNFYERAIILARTLKDSKQETQLLDQLSKMLRRK
ncbi:MAG: tetratricopeptide repeat protein, partial [Nostoc sp.]